jgi:vacuolar-type H+-ATPase subunit B/Vma2
MKKLQKNEQRILKLADELEKQQLDNSYKNENICENLRISTAILKIFRESHGTGVKILEISI